MHPPDFKTTLSKPIKRDILRFKRDNQKLLSSRQLRVHLYKYLHNAGHDHLEYRHIDKWLIDFDWISDITIKPQGPMGRQLLREVKSEARVGAKKKKRITKTKVSKVKTRSKTGAIRVVNIRKLQTRSRRLKSKPQEEESDNHSPAQSQQNSDASEEDDEEEENEVEMDQETNSQGNAVETEDSVFDPSHRNFQNPFLGRLPQPQNDAMIRLPPLRRIMYPWLNEPQDGCSRVSYPYYAPRLPAYSVPVNGHSVGQMEFVNTAALSQEEQLQEVQARQRARYTESGMRTLQSLLTPVTSGQFNNLPAPKPTPNRQESRRNFFTPWLDNAPETPPPVLYPEDSLHQSGQVISSSDSVHQHGTPQSGVGAPLLTSSANNVPIPNVTQPRLATGNVGSIHGEQDSRRQTFQELDELIQNRLIRPNLQTPHAFADVLAQMAQEGCGTERNYAVRNRVNQQPHFSGDRNQGLPKSSSLPPFVINPDIFEDDDEDVDVVGVASSSNSTTEEHSQYDREALGEVGLTGDEISRIDSLASTLTFLQRMATDLKVNRMGRRNAFLTPFLTQIAQCYVDELKRVVHGSASSGDVGGNSYQPTSAASSFWTASIRLGNEPGTGRKMKTEQIRKEIITVNDKN